MSQALSWLLGLSKDEQRLNLFRKQVVHGDIHLEHGTVKVRIYGDTADIQQDTPIGTRRETVSYPGLSTLF